MEERINKILTYFNLTSTQFADKIGVQRSSVSHVLSGRNKPGFDFIQKIIGTFPDISAEWLITGIGSMLKEEFQRQDELFIEQKSSDDSLDDIKSDDKEGKKGEIADSIDEKAPSPSTARKTIDRIIVFYDDKSFEEYRPQ